jgi:hypothetical protein
VGLCEDVRHNIEAQVATHATNATLERSFVDPQAYIGEYLLDSEDSLFKSMSSTLGTFFTNSVDVNLALTQAFISMALCIEIRLDGWAAISPSLYSASEEATSASRPWQSFLDSEEEHAWLALKRASHRPAWTDHSSPALFRVLEQLATELEDVREKIKNLDQLIAVRKTMLQASNLDILASEPPSLMNSPVQGSFLEVPGQFLSSSRSSSRARGRDGLDASNSRTTSPNPAARRRDESRGSSRSPGPRSNVFRPPPPDNPSTTDVLMQTISLPVNGLPDPEHKDRGVRSASLNHVLTNIVVLQEFILELTAVLQVRAAVLGPREVQSVV